MVLKRIICSLLLMILVTTNIQIATSDTIAETTNFFDYIEVVRNLSTVAGKLRVLEAVWAEIRSDYHGDLELVESLHKSIYELQSQTTLDIYVAQQQELDEFNQEVREVIITKNGQYLAQILNVATQPLEHNAKEFCEKIVNSFDYDAAVPKKIFEYAIDKLYGLKSAIELAAFLNSFHNREIKSTELVFHTQLYLYWKAVGRSDVDSEYLLHIAYYMQQTEFKQLVNSKRRNFIKSLPTSVQSLFFSPKICFFNAKTREYLYEYTGEALDTKRQRLFTWRVPNFKPDYSCQFNVELAEGGATINTFIRNTYYNQYIYRDGNDNNKIFAWIPTEQVPTNGNWILSLNDNKMRFFQDDLYLCAAEPNDSERLNIRAIEQNAIENVSEECEWQINDCTAK